MVVVFIVLGVAILSFCIGAWVGMRSMGRNLDRVLSAMTPDEIRVLGQRTRARRVLAGTELPEPEPEPPAA